jgi:hypothetical protein
MTAARDEQPGLDDLGPSALLDLRHRLPLCHAMVETLKVPAWKAMRVATATHHPSREAAAEVDRRIASRLRHAGPRTIDRARPQASGATSGFPQATMSGPDPADSSPRDAA